MLANGADLATLTTKVALAQARGVGVILYLSLVFNKGCSWKRGVYTQAAAEYRRFPSDVLKLYVKNDKGEMVPYSAFMTMRKTQGPNEITFNFGPEMKQPGAVGGVLPPRGYVTNYLDGNVAVIDLDPASPTYHRVIGRIGLTQPPTVQLR